MRSSILALLTGIVIALTSPTLRISVAVNEGIDADSSSQSFLTTDDFFNLDGVFILKVPYEDLVVTPGNVAPGQVLLLDARTGSSSEEFRLHGGNLYAADTNGGPPLVVLATPSGALALGAPTGSFKPVSVGAFGSDSGAGTRELKQFDPNSGVPPRPFTVLGEIDSGSRIALGGGPGPDVTLQIQLVGNY